MADPPVGLIGCVKAKRRTPCEARDLYVSTFFRAGRAYLEARCPEWGIVSARYGLLLPRDVAAPYELVVRAKGIIRAAGGYVEMTAAERAEWAARVRGQLAARWPGRSFLSLLSADYAAVLGDRSRESPLDGLRIFERTAWLCRAVRGMGRELPCRK